MFKNLLFLTVLAVIGFYGWRHFTTPPPLPSAEEEVSAVVGQPVIACKDLSAICAKHPKLVERALKGKTIAVSGKLSKALVLGVKSNDISLELLGAPPFKIMFRSDFDKEKRWSRNSGEQGMRFEKRGRELQCLQVVKKQSDGEQTAPAESIYPQIDTSSEESVLRSIVGKVAEAYGSLKNGSQPASASGTTTNRHMPQKTERRVLCREGDPITLRGEFLHIGSGWIKLHLKELP